MVMSSMTSLNSRHTKRAPTDQLAPIICSPPRMYSSCDIGSRLVARTAFAGRTSPDDAVSMAISSPKSDGEPSGLMVAPSGKMYQKVSSYSRPASRMLVFDAIGRWYWP